MRTTEEYLRDKPFARSTTIASREKRIEVIEQLNREIEAKKRATRKSLIERFLPWYWRRG
jgi:hypothetical protein